MKHKILLLLFTVFAFQLYAQDEDAWVYLEEKDNVEAAISNPLTILTQRAIDRKNAHGVIIDARDVPVNENHITTLKAQPGITVMAKSKWLNAVHVRGTVENINMLSDLEFVFSIDFADKSLNAESGRFSENEDKFEIEETLTDFTYGNTQNQVEMISADDLHLDDFTGEGMLVAVIDAGFTNVNTMSAFQRLRDNGDLLDGYDFVDRTENVYAYTANTHGTRVLSTMAAYVQDEYVGTAPDASYYLFRTEDAGSENPVEESYWVEAAERADSLGVDVINTSLGYTTYDNPNYSYTNEDMDGQTAFITRGATIASEKGMLVITSAGNSGGNAWVIVGAPADSPNVLSIGAVDSNEDYAFFSSQGSAIQPTQKPDVAAQGLGAYVVNENDEIITNNGTSLSSPILAGGAVCLWQALPNASNTEIMQYIRMSASQYTTPDNFLGYGIPDLALAYNIALSMQEQEIVEFKLFPNPVNDLLNIHIPSQFESANFLMYDMVGNIILEQTLSNSVEQMDCSEIASGVYVLVLQSGDSSKTFKLIKS